MGKCMFLSLFLPGFEFLRYFLISYFLFLIPYFLPLAIPSSHDCAEIKSHPPPRKACYLVPFYRPRH
jgi:hypothetical protein